MINLLPDTHKKELGAARNNVVLINYNFLLLGVVGFLLLASLTVFAILTTAKTNAETTKTSNNNRLNEFGDTKTRADTYRTNLEAAKKILSNEVAYTSIIFAITEQLPKDVVLDSLDLNSKDFGKPTMLSAHAKSYAAVAELKKKFEKSDLFSDVHFQSITNDSAGGSGNTAYPLGVTINVTINKAKVMAK